MPARDGMTALVAQLRMMTNADPTAFPDETLQAALDATARPFYRVALIACPNYADGALLYRDFAIPAEYGRALEQADAFVIRTSDGTLIDPADYTYHAEQSRVRFVDDQGAVNRYLDGVAYDLHRAAAEIWAAKAALVAAEVDWRADNHAFSNSDTFEHCLQMAGLHARLAGPIISKLVREDLA